MTNHFTSGGGEQNIAQGENAIGKQVNNYGVPYEAYGELAGKYAVTESALASFFKILEEQQVAPGDLDSKLREIATQYKELLSRLETVQSADPQVVRLKGEARQAIEAGEYAKAEALLNQAEARDMQAIEELEQTAKQRRISAAETNADQARLQRVQYRYAKAAEYWQKAAALMPDDKKKERSLYLNNAGYNLHCIANYKEAWHLFEKSLSISQEIGDKATEGRALNNIANIHNALGDYDKAMTLYKHSLTISREISDKEGESGLLNNIAEIYRRRSDYPVALEYLEQSLIISREISDRAAESRVLNNIGQIYKRRNDYRIALIYLKESLIIQQEICDKTGEATTIWNIGRIYENIGRACRDQGILNYAAQHISRAVQLAEEIDDLNLKEWHKALVELRAQVRAVREPPLRSAII